MTTEERMKKLEKRSGLLSLVLVVIMVMLTVDMVSDMFFSTPPELIEAQKGFLVGDEEDRSRTLIAGGNLSLKDKNDKIRTLLYTEEKGSALKILDQNGNLRVSLGEIEGKTELTMWDKNGKVIWKAP